MLEIEGWDLPGGMVFGMAVSGALGLLTVGLVAVLARAVLFPDFGEKDATRHERWWP